MYPGNLPRPQPARTRAHPKYVVGGAKGLGASHIVFGCLLITMGSIGAALNTADFFISTPIWTGLMYLVTGILGVVSSHRNNKCTAVGFLVMSCLCILMVIGGISSASLALSWEHWSTFNGPVGCWYDWQIDHNHCEGLDTARSTVDAANLLFALVEMGLCIASIAVCSHAISKVRHQEGGGGGEAGCGSCCSPCCGGRGQPAYQTLHEVGPDGRLAPVQNFTQLQFHNQPQVALAPRQSYIFPTQQGPAFQGGIEQGATGGTQTVEPAHAQQQQTLLQYHQPPQQQQKEAAVAHVQQGCTSPPPAYNNHSEC
ncbi:PREDICTED: uncharacterized protein LOC109479289 [Branchiostoma belcheri]|uniref:Uncharacterized protein LOC109479289 n=1 Tax=Branchiostoma belcheri TaxID=7741 RepID=A0A6P5A0T1_BRABE|nr:PREDICTED: uncharacterized protein LOC109479289 [Branchiostoma belcheri]